MSLAPGPPEVRPSLFDRTLGLVTWTVPVAAMVGALVTGVLAGRGVAHSAITEDYLVAGFNELILAAIVVGLALAGLLPVVIRNRFTRTTGTISAVAALLAAGAIGGYNTYHEPAAPVILVSGGTTSLDLQAGNMPFSPDSGHTRCYSVPDGHPVAVVQTIDAGTLGTPRRYGPQGTYWIVGGGSLWATLNLPGPGFPAATIELSIDGSGIEFDWFAPRWTGPAEVTAIGVDGTSGRLAFHGLALEAGREPPIGQRSALPPSAFRDFWPSALSGSLSWTCPGPFAPGGEPVKVTQP